jgi:hypothetical protein
MKADGGGKVLHVGSGTDGYWTVDVEVEPGQLTLHQGDKETTNSERIYLRFEIPPEARNKDWRAPRNGDFFIITGGKLMWDGDGFCEVHPTAGSVAGIALADDDSYLMMSKDEVHGVRVVNKPYRKMPEKE